MYHHQNGAALRSSLITITVIIAALAFAFTLLPKGFSGTIDQIGQGSIVVVLAHNKNSVQSLELMELLGRIRPDYPNKVEFVVINVETASGKSFIDQHQGYSSSLLIFDAGGTQVAILGSNTDENTLRKLLDQIQASL